MATSPARAGLDKMRTPATPKMVNTAASRITQWPREKTDGSRVGMRGRVVLLIV